jgi:hypothetical protein
MCPERLTGYPVPAFGLCKEGLTILTDGSLLFRCRAVQTFAEI